MDKLSKVIKRFDEDEIERDDMEWLIGEAKKVKLLEHNLSELIGAIYRYEPQDTYIYDLAEDLDGEK